MGMKDPKDSSLTSSKFPISLVNDQSVSLNHLCKGGLVESIDKDKSKTKPIVNVRTKATDRMGDVPK